MVCTRTVVETVYPRVAHQLNEVLIAILVLSQHNEVVSAKVFFRFLQTLVTTTSHIHLTAEDGLERIKTVFLTLLVDAHADVVKFLNAEHVAMIGNSHTLHAIVNSFIH